MNDLNHTAEAFATALLDIAKSNNQVELCTQNVQNFLNIWNASKDLQNALTHPSISITQKKNCLNELLNNSNDLPYFKNFLRLLADKSKLYIYPKIASHFAIKADEAMGRIKVKLYSAIQLNPEQKNKIIQKLQTQLHKEIQLHEIIDENIIGGLKIEAQDAVYDASLKQHLNKMRENLKNN